MPSQLDLVIPHLQTKPPQAAAPQADPFSAFAHPDAPENPTITHVLAAKKQAFARYGLASTLAELFNIEGELPQAALQHAAHTEKNDPHWRIIMSPVSLVADKDGLVMTATDDTSAFDDAALLKEIQRTVEEYGLQMEEDATPTGTAPHWILRATTITPAPTIRCTPLEQALFQRIDHLLPQGDGAIAFHRLMNDMQMLLTQTIERRSFAPDFATQAPLPNAVWLWGAGCLPEKSSLPAAHWSVIYSNAHTDELTALGQLTHTPVKPLPKHFTELPLNDNEKILLILDRMPPQTLAENWLNPVLTALQKKRLHSASLYPCDGQRYAMQPLSLFDRLKQTYFLSKKNHA